MPPSPLLAIREGRVTFGGRPSFADVSVALGKGDHACLVGRRDTATVRPAAPVAIGIGDGEHGCHKPFR